MSEKIFESISNAVKHWYIPFIIGLIMIAMGAWTFTCPLESYVALAILFSVSFLVSGLIETYFAIANRHQIKNWGWSLASGIITLIVGLLLVSAPVVSMITLPFYVGFMLLFRSVSAIGFAFDLKNYGDKSWVNLLIVGILGSLFSFILLWNPAFAGMSIIAWTGISFLVSGIFSIYLSLRLRKLHKLGKDL